MRFPINSSKVALHARATLDVPEEQKGDIQGCLCPFSSAANEKLSITDNVGENEVPAGEEGPDFPHSYVGVEISRARLWNTRSELSVAQTSEHRGQGRDQEAQHDSWTYRRPAFL